MKLVKKKKKVASTTPRRTKVMIFSVLSLLGLVLVVLTMFSLWFASRANAQSQIIRTRSGLSELVAAGPKLERFGNGDMRFTAFLKPPECTPPSNDRIAAVLRDNHFVLKDQHVGACHIVWVVGRQ